MHKKFLAIAIASAITPPFIAMADEGTVTLFGNTNVAVERIDNGLAEDTEVNTNISILGVKGAEPLGNGLKAVFLLETSINLDDGAGTTGTLFGGARDAWAGLQGGFGTVAVGVQSQPFKTATTRLDVFGATIADYGAVMGNVQGFNLYETTIPNSIIYFAPNVTGFSGHLQYGFDEDDSIDADRWGAQVNYTNGPLYLTYAYADRDEFDIDGAAETLFTGADMGAHKIGASYTFAQATTVIALYEDLHSDDAAAERDAFYLGVSHKLGNNILKAAYANISESEAPGANDGADYYAIGLSHLFSKRTEIYGLYARTGNDPGGFYGLGQAGSSGALRAGAAGEDVDAIAIGVKHAF